MTSRMAATPSMIWDDCLLGAWGMISPKLPPKPPLSPASPLAGSPMTEDYSLLESDSCILSKLA
eukprot:CAMPEP_0173254136 /NCGR_PEP_ID=MMETSP1142-20121109/21749_1 /TAXON_ID=483371 /ORGANISM="non described non described, Strain CCMP2298" /LENGTH=63 /DNA_ID=CAMNT_0014187525 /DNA_START=32 /DNA_END=223 /DNA_ORIENTATION=+